MSENLCYDGGTCRHSDLIDQLRAENAKLHEVLEQVDALSTSVTPSSMYSSVNEHAHWRHAKIHEIIGNALGGSHE